MACSQSHGHCVLAGLFQAYIALVGAGVQGMQLEPALDALRAGLRLQLQIDEEILLPLLLQISAGKWSAGAAGDLDRALFEHVRADHAGCLALLDWLEQTMPADAQHPLQEPSREAIVAVLAAYVLPHLREVITLCPRLAAAGVDTLDLQQRMAARHQQLDGRPSSSMG